MNAVLTPQLEITEERTFTARLNGKTIAGLAVASTWKGLTEYVQSNGDHLIVLDADARIVTGAAALLHQLGITTHPVALNPGEVYVGIVTDSNGKPLHHLALLEGETEDSTWQASMAWVEKVGGVLPSRTEQRLLFEKVKSEFKPRWYWSSTQHAANSDCAWIQFFDFGDQSLFHKSYEGRARAVRRLPI